MTAPPDVAVHIQRERERERESTAGHTRMRHVMLGACCVLFAWMCATAVEAAAKHKAVGKTRGIRRPSSGCQSGCGCAGHNGGILVAGSSGLLPNHLFVFSMYSRGEAQRRGARERQPYLMLGLLLGLRREERGVGVHFSGTVTTHLNVTLVADGLPLPAHSNTTVYSRIHLASAADNEPSD